MKTEELQLLLTVKKRSLKGRSSKGWAALVLSLLLLFMSACGMSSKTENFRSGNNANPTAAVNKDPITITFSTFNLWGTNNGIKNVIKLYEDETGNKVDLQLYPDDQFPNIIRTKLATDDAPDVFAIWPVGNLFSEELIDVLDGPWVKLVDPGAIKRQYGRASDHQIVTAPFGPANAFGVIYNKEVFAKAGIHLPLKTYNDFLEACEKIKAIGVIPLAFPNKEDYTAQGIFLAGSNFVFEENPNLAEEIVANKLKPQDAPELVELLQRALALKEKGYISENYMSLQHSEARQLLVDGKAAMFAFPDVDYSEFKKLAGDKISNLGMMPITLGDEYIAVVKGLSGNGLWLPSGSRNKEAAKDFINLMVSEKYMKLYFASNPGFSPMEGYDLPGSEWSDEMNKYANEFPVKDTWTNQYFPSGFLDAGSMFQNVFAGKDIKKGLADMYTDYSKQARAKNIPGF